MYDRQDIIIAIYNMVTIGQSTPGFRNWLNERNNFDLAQDYFENTGIFIYPVYSDKFMEIKFSRHENSF